MAYLFDAGAGIFFPLAPHHTFGRLASAVDTQVDKPYISKLHAAIEWTGRTWRIKNLGLNGTRINGNALGQGDQVDLCVGDEIHFV
ncbi:MAG: FHA domain-containing protein, partial [Moraxellaceae bacterium]